MGLDDAPVLRNVDDKKAPVSERIEHSEDSHTVLQVQILGPERLACRNDLQDPTKVRAIEREFAGTCFQPEVVPKRLRITPS